MESRETKNVRIIVSTRLVDAVVNATERNRRPLLMCYSLIFFSWSCELLLLRCPPLARYLVSRTANLQDCAVGVIPPVRMQGEHHRFPRPPLLSLPWEGLRFLRCRFVITAFV